ncbi:uncharacterized protein LOC141685336 [Apium graveolens]|uniref:uncharacterized protein LOC141685336 n=1 Tax=Apium graveolens TaxID=4045 RepID=UPI003D7980C0
MVDDLVKKQQDITGNPHLILNKKQQQLYALAEIHNIFKSIGKSFENYSQMPQPPHIGVPQHYHVVGGQEGGGMFFVYGSGGCGITFPWRTIIAKLRSRCDIVLSVASSGIAKTLMFGGRTTHSRFKIPIVLNVHFMCSISHMSDIAELVKQTKIIIWDEAPMQHRYSFECVDRSLRDIMKVVDLGRFHMPFWGIIVVLGIARVFKLRHNMRLSTGNSLGEVQDLRDFTAWVLDIGDGNIGPSNGGTDGEDGDYIFIPESFCHLTPLSKVVTREREKHSQLEAYFTLNATDSNAVQYLYDEIP